MPSKRFLKTYVILLQLLNQALLVYAAYKELHSGKETLFNIYPNTQMQGVTRYHYTAGHSKIIECIQNCRRDQPRCRAIHVKTFAKDKECEYYDDTKGPFVKDGQYRLYSLNKISRSSYCKEMSFMNLCGKCQCGDADGSVFTHRCDCRADHPEISSCKNVTLSAEYKVQFNENATKNGFCEVRKSVSAKGLTWMRRYNVYSGDEFATDDIKRFYEGFGRPYEENYWLGLKYVDMYTNAEKTVLRVDMMTSSGKFYWGQYVNFKVTKYDTGVEKKYRYEYSRFRSVCCMQNIFNVDGSPFTRCDQYGNEFWFDKCNGDRPTAQGMIYMRTTYQKRISLTLEHEDCRRQRRRT